MNTREQIISEIEETHYNASSSHLEKELVISTIIESSEKIVTNNSVSLSEISVSTHHENVENKETTKTNEENTSDVVNSGILNVLIPSNFNNKIIEEENSLIKSNENLNSTIIASKPIIENKDNSEIFLKDQFNSKSNILGQNNYFGSIKVSVKYEEAKSRLVITIHEANGLINTDKNSFSDPYCRIYLLPDEKQNSKLKTKVIKNNLNPQWEESFFYVMTYAEALSKCLYINLKDQKGFFEKQDTQFLGELSIKLNSVNLKSGICEWYYLEKRKN